MKYYLLTLIIGLFASNTFAQINCSITNEYYRIFKVEKKEYGDREFLYQTVNKIDNKSCFSDLVNSNKDYINYLRQHFTSNINYGNLLTIENADNLQDSYLKALENDQEFNGVMKKLASRVTEPSKIIQDTITLDQMLNIAVKYFSIKGITEEGYYEGKVCAGINGIKQTEKIRHPHIEAFCFSTILNNLKGDEFSIYDEFVKGIKELYKINLGLADEERLLRAQGAMYMFMRKNKQLAELLLTEYQRKKKYLPFLLKLN